VNTERTIAVALSGGVDSAVSAALLLETGAEVFALTMRLPTLGPPDTERIAAGRLADAERVAEALGLDHEVVELGDEFETHVLRPFCEAYGRGRTPNPCALCNPRIKFGKLAELARALGADALATGHYARIEQTGEGPALLRGAGPEDQSYFLYALSARQLAHTLFPVGGLAKSAVRAIARRLQLPVHDKQDSQDLCFLPAGDYTAALERFAPHALQPGPVLHVDGRELGRHQGIGRYTIGQRRGLGIAHTEPLYVVGFDVDRHAVVAGERAHLRHRTVEVTEPRMQAGAPPLPLDALVKVRYNHPGAHARVSALGRDRLLVEFDEPQEAPCPGQAAVFYGRHAAADRVLGGGLIDRVPARPRTP
jgi:tRNA-specific 2-thiouridylase